MTDDYYSESTTTQSQEAVETTPTATPSIDTSKFVPIEQYQQLS